MLTCSPIAAAAQDNITIEATDGFRFIRCVELFGVGASCEFLSDGPGFLKCVAFDRSGEPIAVANAPHEGPAMYQGISADEIDKVVCE